MKILKLMLCLLMLNVASHASLVSKSNPMLRETMKYQDSCGNNWILIIHFEDQGNETANNNERASHYGDLIDGLEQKCADTPT